MTMEQSPTCPREDTLAWMHLSIRESNWKIPSENTSDPIFDFFPFIFLRACTAGDLCGKARVTVLVTPVAKNDVVQSSLVGGLIQTNVLDNDSGRDMEVMYVQPASNGACWIMGNGLVAYGPNDASFLRTDRCFYTVCTDKVACDTAELIVSVIPQPTAMPTETPTLGPTDPWYFPDWLNGQGKTIPHICLSCIPNPLIEI